MSEQFSILIDSRTRFETGEPGGVWLSMPTTKEQLHEAMSTQFLSLAKIIHILALAIIRLSVYNYTNRA